MAVKALYVGTIQTDLQVEAVDLSVAPSPVVSMPADITISAMIWNHGEATVSPVKVVLYQGDPLLGVIEGEREVSIPGYSFTSVDFPVHLETSGDVEYFVLVDPEDLIAEVSEKNNVAAIAFGAGLQPTVGFDLVSASGPESATNVAIDLSLSHGWDQTIAVNLEVGFESTATSGTDYNFTSDPVVFSPGETRKTVSVNIVNDTLEEANESIVIKLSNPQEAVLGVDAFTYTILDNDAAPQVVITSPLDNETFTSGQVTLHYQTNMPEEQVAVYLNGVAVTTREGESLVIQGNDFYTVRVVATNANNISAEDVVSIEVDDSGEEPALVWKDFLHAGTSGGKYYTCLQYGKDGAVYAVRPEPSIVKKFDQSGYVHWSEALPVQNYSHNYCKDSTMTEDAYVILDATSIRWFSDASNASGVLSHSAALPVYADSSPWSKFTMDSSDNYYLVGPTKEGISKNSSDSGNIQLAKIDVANNVIWRRVIATDFADIATDIVTDGAGNVFLLGTTEGYLGQGGGSNAGETDVFLIKMDPDGSELWRHQWGTSLTENSSQLAVDSQGNVVLVGDTYGTFDGSGPTFDQDAFIIKVAPDGTELWLSQDHGISGGQVLTITQEDDVVIAGWFGRKKSGFFVNLNVEWSRYTADGGHVWTNSISTGSLSYDETVR
ncbi:MAG: hypothetical protein KAU27_03650, partial [Desulfuromonadales bacterium]|nr:hypothetical protein [Desulfuromonadales bacterium]